jgi:hypothetical protein
MGGVPNRTQHIVNKLKEKGHRITPQRLVILRILAESNGLQASRCICSFHAGQTRAQTNLLTPLLRSPSLRPER